MKKQTLNHYKSRNYKGIAPIYAICTLSDLTPLFSDIHHLIPLFTVKIKEISIKQNLHFSQEQLVCGIGIIRITVEARSECNKA